MSGLRKPRLWPKKDVHVVPHKDDWATRKEDVQRPELVVDTQKAANLRATTDAKRANAQVVVHRIDGTIRVGDSYGNDPNPPKDKKH